MEKINFFITHILQSGDLAQTARHEAGHRFMWRLAYPATATRYDVVNGLPCVTPADSKTHWIADMAIEDASKMVYVKLAGHASEMIYLGLAADDDIAEIVDWLVADYYSDSSRLDWSDDAASNGDISDAFKLIGGKVGWSRENLEQNTKTILKSIISAFRANQANYEAECDEAYQQFAAWQAQGKISI